MGRYFSTGSGIYISMVVMKLAKEIGTGMKYLSLCIRCR